MRNFILLALLLGYFNSFGQLTVNVVTTNATCGGSCDGTATATPSGGTPPYTYSWNTVPVQTTPTPSGLCPGVYIVTVMDSTGTTVSDTFAISNSTVITATNTTTDDTCGLCVGSANVNVFGGSPPYTFLWAPLGVTTAFSPNLCAGNYTCYITDNNGCSGVFNAVVNMIPSPTCELGTVSGKVYNDVNTNCIQDTLENGLRNTMLQAMPGPYYASTNTSGEYSMVLPFGNYTITQVLPTYYNEICPVSGSYSLVVDSVTNTFTNIDFADSVISVQDVRVQLSSTTPRPGFLFTYYFSYSSLNIVPMNGMVSLVVDTMLSYNYSSIVPDIISGDTLFWNYSNLQMFEYRAITATFYVPADVNLLGDTLSACAQITPLIGDVNLADNTVCHDRIIVGSYDPNDKQVSPQGDILLSDNELKYTIRFQNTGTDTAFTVVVVDTLSSKLDVTSIKKIMASHPFEYNISGQGVLTFTFNNILLPDSNVNEPASHGLIEFTINQHPSNSVGTIIENTAEIYFDFNPAVVTNTATNTIVLPTTIEEIKLSNAVSVYPNPTEGRIKISFNTTYENEVSFALFDITGRKVNELTQNKKMTGTQVLDWNIGHVKSGIYFLSVKIGDKNYTNKIVVR